MSRGSHRITIRIGTEMRDDIDLAVTCRNSLSGNLKNWTVSEFVIQAIVDKLNHDRRGRRAADRRRQQKIDDNQPREYWEE